MAASFYHKSAGSKVIAHQSGQTMVEFAVVVSLMLVLVCALVDFGRALNFMEVMVGLTRQGSNLASRGTSLPNSAAAVVAGQSSLDMSHQGQVIVTSITNTNRIYTITGQVSLGNSLGSSKIGQGVGNLATVPAAAASMLAPGQTIYVTEVFYSYQPLTPIGNLLKIVMPSTLYEAAYF